MAISLPRQPGGQRDGDSAARLFRQLTDVAGHRPRAPLRQKLLDLGEAAVPVLAQGLADNDPYVRFEAINLLGELAIPKTLPLILGFALDEYETRARWRAFWAVTRLPEEMTLPKLREALAGREWQVRWHAALMLSMLGWSDAIPVIAEGLSAGDEVTRWEALGAARTLSASELAERVTGFLDLTQPVYVRQEATMALGRMDGAAAFAGLARALADPVAGVRWRAALALGAFGPTAVALLERQLARESNRQVARRIEKTLLKLFRG